MTEELLALAPLISAQSIGTDISGLVLAIEVLSSSAARDDHGLKRRFYQRNGVSEN